MEQLSQLIDAQPRRLSLEPSITIFSFEKERTLLPGETTNGTGNLGTSGINKSKRLHSDKLAARPPGDDLPPYLFASLDFRRSSEERFCRFFESLRSNEDESPAFFMVVLIVSKAK